jgi:RNA polymerase sigma-70 factor (ECF subfamily)
MTRRYGRSRQPEYLRSSDLLGGLDAWERENSGDNEEQLARLRRNLKKARETELTAKQAEILHMYYDLGMSVPRIAQEKGLHKSTVSRTLARGRERLKRYLQYSW